MLLSIDTHFALRRDGVATGDIIIVFVLVSSYDFPRGMMGSGSPCKTARGSGRNDINTESVCGCGVYGLLHRFLFSTKEQNYEIVANCHKGRDVLI